MLARSVTRLPPPRTGGWVYEPKLDGYRHAAELQLMSHSSCCAMAYMAS